MDFSASSGGTSDPPTIPLSPSVPPPVLPPKAPRKSKTAPIEPSNRVKVYPEGSNGPWVVFFRPKGKALNIMQISKDLVKHFSAVTEIFKVRPNKLRVTVSCLKQANAIAGFELFTREYRVYVPARVVEIDGVVTDAGLTVEDVLKFGSGRFKNSNIQPVKILDCKHLHSVSFDNGEKRYTPSDSLRVTFAGSALPSFIDVNRVRLPVRLFVPRVMHCLRCKQLGHTATHCSNKIRCGKCGENHEDSTCSKDTARCLYCGETPHELSSCPAYKLRGEKIKRSLKERSKRTFAEMLKKTAATDQTSPNIFEVLPIDESENDDPFEGSSGYSFTESRKRKNSSSPQLPRKETKTSSNGMTNTIKSKSAEVKPKQTPPGFLNFNSQKEFPALPGTAKTPAVSSFESESQPESGLLNFSDIVDWILTTFNITDPLKSFLLAFLPTVKTFLKQLTAKWPLLAAIVSFDG